MDTREILVTARDLIREKRYQDALDLLKPLDHPLAQQWTVKLQMLLAKERREKHTTPPSPPPTTQKSLPTAKPWNPHSFAIVHLFINVFIVGILLGWNWRRLGRPQWVLPTIAFSITVPILMIGSIIYFADQFGLAGQLSFPLVPILIISGLLFLNLDGIYWMMYVQGQGYKQWEKYGAEAMVNHRYDVTRETAIALLVWVACVGGITFILSRDLQLQTYSNDRYTLSYPAGWDSYTLGEVNLCQQATFYTCDLFLYDDFSAMSLLILSYPTNVPLTSAELEEWAWTNYAPVDYSDAYDRSVYTDFANGNEFTYRRYRAPNYSNPSEILFFQHIYVTQENIAVEFIVSRPYRICDECDSYDDLQYIYRSIQFALLPDA